MNFREAASRHGRMGRRRRGGGATALAEWENERLTPDDKYARVRSIAWARRIMKAYRPFNPALLEWAAWVLGPAETALAQGIVDLLPPLQRQECEDAWEDRSLTSRTLNEILQRLDRRALAAVYALLDQTLAARAESLETDEPCPLRQHLDHFTGLLRLEPAERELVEFLLLSETTRAVDAFFDGDLDSRQFSGRRYLAALLDVPVLTLPGLVSGRLSRMGVIDERHRVDLEGDFMKLLLAPPGQALETGFVQVREAPALPLEAHAVPRDAVEHLAGLLRHAPAKESTHVLLYGPPGTGKTSFARALAAAAGCRLAEVNRTADNAGKHRRFALEAGRNLAASVGDVVVLVDEADHLLRTHAGPFGWMEWGESRDKGWLNAFLDEPGLRAIWVVNDLDGIEDSVQRRFCFSLPFRPLNRGQRERAWRAVLAAEGAAGKLRVKDIRDLAARYPVSAGVMALAVRKAEDLGHPAGKRFREAVVLSLEAHGRLARGGVPPTRDRAEADYDLDALCVRGDLAAVTARLKRYSEALESAGEGTLPRVNLLLYGPPGTGKSEWARHLAGELRREVMERRASDIVSCFVGQTERNLAGAFAEAEAAGAVLVFDEADTFLLARSGARRSWEVSAVNEFLAQMERFRGILVCTTNRLTALDEASLRRFGEKLAFDWLTAEGKARLFGRMLAPLLARAEAADAVGRASERLAEIPCLAPGDFRVVRDRFAFLPRGTATLEALLDALEAESACKTEREGRKPIGF